MAEGTLHDAAVARSPVAPVAPVVVRDGWEVSARTSAAALRLSDATPLAKLLLHAAPDGPARTALGPFGRTSRPAPETLAIGAAPGEWLVLGAVGSVAALRETMRALLAYDADSHLIDATHQRALFRLSGEAAPDLLAKVCAIDLGDRNVSNGSAFTSSVARAQAGVVRDDVEGTRAYLLHTEWSLGRYLWDALLDAGAEFGMEVEGLQAPGI